MKDDTIGHAQPSRVPRGRKRQVNTRGKEVREVVEGEGRFVRQNSSSIGPEPDFDEVLLLARREVDHAVDTAPHATDPAGSQVPVQELGRVARFGRLRRREVTLRSDRDLEQPVPIRPRVRVCHTARN